MSYSFSRVKLLKVIVFALFITLPAMIIPSHLVYMCRGWLLSKYGIAIPDILFLLLIISTITGGLWISSGWYIKRLLKHSNGMD